MILIKRIVIDSVELKDLSPGEGGNLLYCRQCEEFYSSNLDVYRYFGEGYNPNCCGAQMSLVEVDRSYTPTMQGELSFPAGYQQELF